MKIKYLSCLLAVALVGCGSSKTNTSLRKTDLKILAPSGAPAVAMYNFVNGLTTVTNPQTELIPQFLQNNYDIIVAPAKGGLTNIVKKSANYKMAAVVTFGNFGLVATGNDEDGILNEGDKVLYFQQNDIPGAVFNYLYGDLGLTTYSVDDVKGTATAINTGKVTISGEEIILDYVFSAEPLITNLNKVNKVKAWASEEFLDKSNGKRIIQAAVFVNNNTESTKIDKFLSLLESDLTGAVKNPQKIKKTFELYGEDEEQMDLFGVNALTAYNAMKGHNGLGLGYLYAKTAQEEIDYFINDILNCNLTLNEEVYY